MCLDVVRSQTIELSMDIGAGSQACGSFPSVSVLTTGGKIDDDMARNERWFGKVRNGLGVYFDQLRLPDCDIKIIPVMSRGEHQMTSEDRAGWRARCGRSWKTRVPWW